MDLTKLTGIIPAGIISQIPGLYPYGIDGPKRLSHLLGQCMEETGNFTTFTENLNYSGEVLWKDFPKHFASADEAMAFAHQPERIANRIYADRNGNGSEASGDGWKYRGRGAIQATGKTAYQQLSDAVGVDLVTNPDSLLPDYALVCAAIYFKQNGLWAFCDQGVGQEVIKAITHRVNGGYFNLEQRVAYTLKVWAALTGV